MGSRPGSGRDSSTVRVTTVPSTAGTCSNVGRPTPLGTIVCVHGNPTWSYLWRSVLAGSGDRYRVIAVDQLGMGYSERTDPRSLRRPGYVTSAT